MQSLVRRSGSESQLVPIKIKPFQDGIFCHFVASMISGLVTTIASMPVDIAKTRLQSMKYVDGKTFPQELMFVIF